MGTALPTTKGTADATKSAIMKTAALISEIATFAMMAVPQIESETDIATKNVKSKSATSTRRTASSNVRMGVIKTGSATTIVMTTVTTKTAFGI